MLSLIQEEEKRGKGSSLSPLWDEKTCWLEIWKVEGFDVFCFVSCPSVDSRLKIAFNSRAMQQSSHIIIVRIE